jgi:non-heme chloroperoxidase
MASSAWPDEPRDEIERGLRDLLTHVAGSGIALAQMANANLNPWTESKVDTKNPDRGPLLILDGERDHTVPWAIANASYKRQKRNTSVTEIMKMPNRGHSLTSTTAGGASPRPRRGRSSGRT